MSFGRSCLKSLGKNYAFANSLMSAVCGVLIGVTFSFPEFVNIHKWFFVAIIIFIVTLFKFYLCKLAKTTKEHANRFGLTRMKTTKMLIALVVLGFLWAIQCAGQDNIPNFLYCLISAAIVLIYIMYIY